VYADFVAELVLIEFGWNSHDPTAPVASVSLDLDTNMRAKYSDLSY